MRGVRFVQAGANNGEGEDVKVLDCHSDVDYKQVDVLHYAGGPECTGA